MSLIPDQAGDLASAGATSVAEHPASAPAEVGANPAAGTTPAADGNLTAGMSPTEVGVARAALTGSTRSNSAAARTAIGLNPNEAHYYFTHGVTLDALGHADQARQALLISLRLEPENPIAQHRLAVLNGESLRPPEKKRRGWRMFGRRATDGGKPVRPEEFLP